MSRALKLYDLAAANQDLRFSPYCWRIKLAIAHKGMAAQTIPWRFTDKDVIAASGQGKVPVLVDGEAIIHDSQTIAEYLESTYQNEPSLFGDTTSAALMQFVRQWADNVLQPSLSKILIPDIFPQLDPKDQPYFRTTREKFFGLTIEDMAANRAEYLPAFNAALVPIRETLEVQPFICGSGPAYADHIVFGALQWAKLMTATPLWEPGDILQRWMDSVMESYGLN